MRQRTTHLRRSHGWSNPMSKYTQEELRTALLHFIGSAKASIILVGEATLGIGTKASLEEIERGMDRLCKEGLLRELSEEEARKKGLKQGYVRCISNRGQTPEENPAPTAFAPSGTWKADP